MSKVILVVESGADVPVQIAKELNIHIVPMHVEFENETLPDGSFPPEQILEYYQQSRKLPKTSGSTPHDFTVMFDKLQEQPEMSLAEAVEIANDLIERANMCFLPDNLEFLRAGSRCSNAAAIVGGLPGEIMRKTAPFGAVFYVSIH